MKRDLYAKLIQWKNSPRRKPLILRGVRQSGKTYLLRRFGECEFPNLVYFNFEEDPALVQFFEHKLAPQQLVENLSLYSGQKITPAETLIIFDEIQAAPRAVHSLKYFHEEASQYHLAAAGSLLGIRMSGLESFPVGKVNFLDLYPLSFREFLDASGKSEWRQRIETIESFAPLPEPLHRELIEMLKRYFVVGGMPEAVNTYVESGDLHESRTIQREILDAYALDFAKHASPYDVPRIARIWSSIPAQLARENKKFMYSDVARRARAREYENAVEWLANAGVILQAFNISKPGLPLRGYVRHGFFKVYLADVGLLGALAGVPPNIIVKGDGLFTEFRGALVENYVAQQLKKDHNTGLHYWKSKSTAEVDFLLEKESRIFPLEVKAGINPRSKSLRTYGEKFAPPVLSRTSLLNLRCDGEIANYPLYLVDRFPLDAPEKPIA
ncbi:MAG: AAA family ATPase [bacterium]